jgi:hypothetical protein
MVPVSLIDKPLFWIAVMLTEIALPMVVPNKRWLGGLMLAVAGIAFAVAIGWSPSVRPPRISLFAPLALAGSLGIAFSRRWAIGASLRRDAVKITTELEDWSILARAKLPRFTSTAVHSPEAQRLDAEYKEKFGPRIVRLMKPLIAGDSIYIELRDTWLRAGSKVTLDVASSAHLASKFFEKYGNELPIRISNKSVDKSFVKSVTIYFGSALVMWFALFGVTKETPSAVRGPLIDGSGGISGSVTIVKPGPIPRVWFTTISGSNRNITTGGRPKTLRFTKPVEAIVHARELPFKISYSNGYLVVKLFSDRGFLIDEYGATGVEVEAEVFY